MVFYERDKQVLPNHYSRPLNVTASICDVDLRNALTDPGSSLNIMSLSALEVMAIPRNRVIEQPIDVLAFKANASSLLVISISNVLDISILT